MTPSNPRSDASSPPLVDGATHIWSADPAAYPWSPLDQVGPPDGGAEAEGLLRTLGGAGFGAAICVQPRVYGYDHSYLAAALDGHRGSIAGVCLIDPESDRAPAILEEHVIRGSFTGARLVANDRQQTGWLDGPAGDPFWSAAAEYGVPVSVLVAPQQLVAVRARALRSPAATVVIDHLGLLTPGQAGQHLGDLLACAAAENVAVKLSALPELSAEPWPFLDLAPIARAVIAEFGPQRVVFGTDWPYALDRGPWGDQLRALEAWGFDVTGNEGLFGANAARLWKLQPSGGNG